MTIRQSSKDRLGLGSLIALAVGTFTLGTDAMVLNGLLPTIATDLHVSESGAGQLTTVFALTYAISSPLIAAFTGGWDRRILLAGGLGLFTVGMAGQALGTTFAVVAVARALAAIGAAAFQANAYALAGALSSDERRGRALATVAAGMSVSTVLGVPIGVLAGHWIGWRAVMWAIAAIGVAVAAYLPFLPAVRIPAANLRTRLAVVARPPVARVLLVTVVGMLAGVTVFVYLPVLVEPVATGVTLSWVLVAAGAGQVIGTTIAGRWTDRFGSRRVLVWALAGTAVVLAAMDVAVLALPALFVAVLASGTFGGMLMVPQQHRLFSIAPDASTVALGLNGSAIYVGIALGSALGGTVLAGAGAGWLGPVGAAAAVAALVLATARRRAAPVAIPEPVSPR
ncbi:MFS transporter [Amycolatopsis sp. NPDC059027]|uniref:MFS transporter n=1 Tax=unclassified Amycolatopsis TaxID=2618356 RepID=UPI00366E80C7